MTQPRDRRKYFREYQRRPDVKEKKREYQRRPDVKEKKREYIATRKEERRMRYLKARGFL